ncbi:FAS-associated death domain protein isoform X2 [Narcine bancroftii]|uniref:FAS-associated death domain protein isoform X2 n=1 Tax=Narcine bancroftii TaxID=1343680 RepID=UPI00383177FE
MEASERLRFQTVLLDISQNLTEDNLSTLKCFCAEQIGKRRLETLRSGLELFQALEELSLLSPAEPAFLTELLTVIKRPDLGNKLKAFHSTDGPPIAEVGGDSSNLDLAIDVVCDNVGKDWWMLVRRLGLGESQIQSEGSFPNMGLHCSRLCFRNFDRLLQNFFTFK